MVDLLAVPPLSDKFNATLNVGDNRSVTFQSSWTLSDATGSSPVIEPRGQLNLNGGVSPSTAATIHGASQNLNGKVNVDLEAGFHAPTTLNVAVHVDLPHSDGTLSIEIGGLIPAIQYDQFNVGVPESVMYVNTTTETGILNLGGIEFGDHITLAGTDRTVTKFEFGYTEIFEEDGDEKVRIRFYANDGAGGKPGTPLFDSGEISLGAAVFPVLSPVVLDGLSVTVPDTFTWSFQLDGIDFGNESAFTFAYDPPTVGSSDQNGWYRPTGPDWVQFSGSTVSPPSICMHV